MGRIRTRNIKRFVTNFLERELSIFTTDFESNKPILQRVLGTNISKRLRNRINGYIICRLRKELV